MILQLKTRNYTNERGRITMLSILILGLLPLNVYAEKLAVMSKNAKY